MNVSEAASSSFVLIQGGWPAAQSLELIQNLRATHVIVRCRGPHGVYLLLTMSEALYLLEGRKTAATPTEALLPTTSRVAPLLESGARIRGASQRCIVVEDGEVVGFIDPADRPRIRRGVASIVSGRQPREYGTPLSLVAKFPEEIAPGKTASLSISLNARPAGASDLPLKLRRGAKVDVIIRASRGLALVGSGEGCLVFEGGATPLRFKVKGVSAGLGLIRVYAYHQNRSLGSVRLRPTVAEAGGVTTRRPLKVARALQPCDGGRPDLSLLIFEGTVNGTPALSFRLSAADPTLDLHLKSYRPVPLRSGALQYFQEFFQDIENLPVGDAGQQAETMARLERKGSSLFESLIPEEMRKDIWRLRSRISSVWIESEEPWVPWELCRMSGDENGRIIDGPFFCEAFNLTRWIPGVPQRPRLSLENMALILPQNSGLDYARAEQEYLSSLAVGGRKVSRIPARYIDVLTALCKSEYDGLHFSGHGIGRADEPNRSQIILESHTALTPEDLTGEVRNLGSRQPFIFLNACQSGRMGMSLTDIGGWAKGFLNAGAGAFVGTYWSIYDRSAYNFTRAFYDGLLQGKPVGEATREAREAIKLAGDPTWLAYTVFADPLAVLRDAQTGRRSGRRQTSPTPYL